MSTRLEGFWKDDPKNYTNLFCFLFTRSFQFVQSCNVGPTPAHNLLQTQQNHNLALIIMFTTTKYCKIISSFMLFCKILSGGPISLCSKNAKMLLLSQIKFLISYFFQFPYNMYIRAYHHMPCQLSYARSNFCLMKKNSIFFIWRSYIWTNTKSNCNRNPWAAYDAL